MSEVLSLGGCAKSAIKELHVFDEGAPDLISTGLAPVDKKIGGLFPGQGGILGLAQGMGKSSTILTSAIMSKDKVGIVFVEDTEDVVGTRALAYHSMVNSLKMRRKDLSEEDLEAIRLAQERLDAEDGVRVVCHPGAGIERIELYVEHLALDGCRLIWLDYVQKVRGITEARNVEVATVYTRFQQACHEAGAAFMVASQFSRQVDPTARPRMSWLKETGDLENEARIGVLGWRDEKDKDLLHYVLEKSTVGGEGLRWSMRRDSSGTLREVTDFEEDW